MPESDTDSEATPPPRRKGVVAVIQRAGRLLVIRRSRHVVAPLAYCFPGGGIEAGEQEEQALRRELREELAVEIAPQRRIWHSTTNWQVELAWWHSELAEGDEPRPNPAEVESVHWLTPEEMAELPELLTSNHAFLRKLAAGEIWLG